MAAERARGADAVVEEPSVAPPRGMEDRGLVVREECSTDGRGAFVVLTKAGLRAIEAAAPPHVRSVRRNLIDVLSRDEIDALATITKKVVAHLSRQTAPA